MPDRIACSPSAVQERSEQRAQLADTLTVLYQRETFAYAFPLERQEWLTGNGWANAAKTGKYGSHSSPTTESRAGRRPPMLHIPQSGLSDSRFGNVERPANRHFVADVHMQLGVIPCLCLSARRIVCTKLDSDLLLIRPRRATSRIMSPLIFCAVVTRHFCLNFSHRIFHGEGST